MYLLNRKLGTHTGHRTVTRIYRATLAAPGAAVDLALATVPAYVVDEAVAEAAGGRLDVARAPQPLPWASAGLFLHRVDV